MCSKSDSRNRAGSSDSTISRNGRRKPARTILAMIRRTRRCPSMSRGNPTTRLSWSRSPTRWQTARISSIATELSTARCPLMAARRRCSSIGSGTAVVSDAASTASVSATAVAVCTIYGMMSSNFGDGGGCPRLPTLWEFHLMFDDKTSNMKSHSVFRWIQKCSLSKSPRVLLKITEQFNEDGR
jgi:hypothetical protein